MGAWGKWKGSRFAGTRPALLEEVLELARDGRRIYLEVKAGPEAVAPIARVLAAQRRANPGNVLFISFHEGVCAALKRELPQRKRQEVGHGQALRNDMPDWNESLADAAGRGRCGGGIT